MIALAGLAEEGKAGFLSGRFWDVAKDLEELMDRKDEIVGGDLYNLRLRKLRSVKNFENLSYLRESSPNKNIEPY